MPKTFDLSRKRDEPPRDHSTPERRSPRVPPHNQSAERALLGIMLMSKDAIGIAAELLSDDDFYSSLHAKIYAAIMQLYASGEPVDAVTLSDKLRNDGKLEELGGLSFLRGLTAEVTSVSNADHYAKIISHNATRRNLIRTSSDVIELAYDSDTETPALVDYAESEIFRLGEKKTQSRFVRIGDVLDDELRRLDELQATGKGVVGLATGFRDFDRLTAGLQPSNLMIVAARPGMGKSTFMTNIAANVAVDHNKPVAMFTMEMSYSEVAQRLICAESRVQASKMKNGMLSPQDWENIMTAVRRLVDAPLHIEDSGYTTLMDVRTKARRLAAQYPDGLGVIIIDYLQLMHSGHRTESRQVEISEISRGLKILARELDCPVIVASQLNRSPESRADKRPLLGDLRESGSIEQDADIVTFLYRDDYYNSESEALGEAELIVAKHRNGPTDTVRLLFIEHQSRFHDYVDVVGGGAPP